MLRYSRSDTELARQASNDEARAAELRAEAGRLRATVDSKQIERASLEAQQANELIDRRTFSWTELLNQFEATLPPNVRITSFRPRIDPRRGNVVTISLVARGVDDVQLFMENLEKTGSFPEIFPPSERTNEHGQLETVIETVYAPQPAAKAAAPPAPEPGGRGPVTTLARRIFAEKRHLVLPLGIAIVANVLLYALVVYPLAIRSAGAADRAARRCSAADRRRTRAAGGARTDRRQGGGGRGVERVLQEGAPGQRLGGAEPDLRAGHRDRPPERRQLRQPCL